MTKHELETILHSVASGTTSVDDAVLRIRTSSYTDIGFASLDTDRELRTGVAEVIYGAGKTPDQISMIAKTLIDRGQKTVLITRISHEAADVVARTVDLDYRPEAHIGIVGTIPEPDGDGRIAVVTGGTSDMPVAEEAAVTAEALGNEVDRLYDVGVAGLHRLLSRVDVIARARVVIAIAGMEGALASVVGGLASCPVIAVPTSVGYGTAFGGIAALLSMLNSCASGVSVVNIDNGFGAAYLASMICHIGGR